MLNTITQINTAVNNFVWGETVRKLSDYPVSTYHMFAH